MPAGDSRRSPVGLTWLQLPAIRDQLDNRMAGPRGCRGDADVGRGWPALVPLKIAQLSIWATDHRDVLGVGPRAE